MNYEAKLRELALADDRIVVMTAENRAPVRGLPGVLAERFIDTGITEQTLVGAAAGLALRGRIPVAHALATFLTMRAFEFIRTDVGIPGLPVKLVGFVPGFLSEANGPTHQAIEDVGILRLVPGLRIFCPADEVEMVEGLPSFIGTNHPGYLRYNPRPAVAEHTPFEWGKAEVFGEGRDIVLVTYGTLFAESWRARAILEKAGYGVTLLNLRSLHPIDERALLTAASSACLVVTIEDHFRTGGVFGILSELCLRNRISPNVMAIALETWFKPTKLETVLDYEGFTGDKLAEKIIKRWEGDYRAK